MIALPTTDRPVAAIDIGTNSIRLLVARASGPDHDLTTLLDESATVRLGMGVEQTGRLEPERVERAVSVVTQYHQLARAHNADPILLAATSAVRDASNGPDLQRRIAAATGLETAIIGGEEEARLTFAGATLGAPNAGNILVADLGGGSLELIAARNGHVHYVDSLRLGSGRLTERHIHGDPPEPGAIALVGRDAKALLAPLGAALGPIDRCIVVGGTAQSLPLVTRQADTRVLTRRDLAEAVAVLLSSSAGKVATQTGLDVARVRTLAAGATIIGELLAVVRLERATIGHGGLREGLILDYLRSGSHSHS